MVLVASESRKSRTILITFNDFITMLRLVTFDTVKPPANQQQPGAKPQSSVHIGRVITEPELVERSQKLETSIQTQVCFILSLI